jgi:hypothetical protein
MGLRLPCKPDAETPKDMRGAGGFHGFPGLGKAWVPAQRRTTRFTMDHKPARGIPESLNHSAFFARWFHKLPGKPGLASDGGGL